MLNAGQPMVEGHDWLSLLLHQRLGFPYSSRLPLLQLALPDSGDFFVLLSAYELNRYNPASSQSTPAYML